MTSPYPKTFEQVDFPYGFLLYKTESPITCLECQFHAPGIRDRGHVIIDRYLAGKVSILKNRYLTLHNVQQGSKIWILVENDGRRCSGYNDPKGLIQNVTLDEVILENWIIYPIDIEKIFDFIAKNETPLKPKDHVNGLCFCYYKFIELCFVKL